MESTGICRRRACGFGEPLLNIIVGWLGFLIAVAGWYGYRLFGGNPNIKQKKIVVLVFSVIIILCATFATYIFSNAKMVQDTFKNDYGTVYTFSQSVDFVFEVLKSDSGVRKEALTSTAINSILGIICACLFVVQSAKRESEKAMLATLIPTTCATMTSSESDVAVSPICNDTVPDTQKNDSDNTNASGSNNK